MEPIPKLESITAQIKNARQTVGITSGALAKKSGISPSAMSKLENGRLKPSYKLVYDVVEALNILIMTQGTAARIENKMAKNVKSLYLDSTTSEASKVMKNKGFSQLPILDRNGHLEGIVTERSLLDHPDAAVCEDALEYDYAIVDPDKSFEKARKIAKNVQALLVMKEGKLVGILTKSDFI
ncbi:MAG: CBS domain-containing protein [Methanothrix sp.]